MDEIDLRAYIGLLIFAGVYRPARHAIDKLAAIREVWEKWVERLPYRYNPGPEVTVDEQLVLFRGRCPFCQYMPSKPAKYGIKIWVACDAQSSYAWKMQVYTGKPTNGGAEKNQGIGVVTDGLRGYTELPSALLTTRGREAFSSKFVFTPTTTLVYYLPKRNKCVFLLRTLHKMAEISDREDMKPDIILDYNHLKAGVDNLDKVTGSCRRMTVHWPLVIFHNIIDVSSFNVFVIWNKTNPTWMPDKQNKKRVFLEQLEKALKQIPHVPSKLHTLTSRTATQKKYQAREHTENKRHREEIELH
ncbi:piggyBac transposable element-derived protein 4-like [Oncorhynchus keta]|uniref:piggyBac transposable element-derived protein 4-like n=1 Tax=Oncorhynchus keta TaxID=8018 RepID=UPI002279F623|nr:piggyBac transposable element-derived protein 4-like [Oncorhynchus keta]